MAKKILITGASGLIGTRLTELLLAKGHEVTHLGRSKKDGRVPSFVWNPNQGTLDINSLHNMDAIIHLAGAGVADKPWTAERKKEIVDSRVKSTALLFQALKNNNSIQSFISASAIGYYGFEDPDKVFTEEDNPGNDFLATVTHQWENEVNKISLLGLRIAKLRIGIVLSEKGGALKEIAKPVKLGIGAPLGSGKQFVSWIHLDDLCNLFIRATEDDTMNGSYNAVMDWCSNASLTKSIATVLNKPLWFPPIPSFLLKILLGERADLILNGSKVSSQKIKGIGFQFKFENLEDALTDLLVRK